jgi:LacI family transcriptional regulator
MRTHPTILDVAQTSGVSKSTVSNVIRGADGVAQETRRRVLEAIAVLGYRPNAVARQLVQRRTSTFGLLVGDLANPFYSELAKLVEQRASEAGYATMISNTDGIPVNETARIESLLEHRVAGVAMLQFSGDRSVIGELLAHGVPLVVVSCWEQRSDCVSVDDAAGGALAVEHLLSLGHRRIAYLSSDLVEPNTDAVRFAGYRQPLERLGIEPRYLRWETLHDNLRTRPTAFFVSNDVVAIRLIEALEELGLRVPADVSVVGFDDIALSGLGRIALTTVAQPRDALARHAVEILLRRTSDGDGLPLQQVRLEPTLVVRGSTGPPR